MEENCLDDSNKSSSPLFYNDRHEKLTREGISYILKTYSDMARKIDPDLIPDKISRKEYENYAEEESMGERFDIYDDTQFGISYGQ